MMSFKLLFKAGILTADVSGDLNIFPSIYDEIYYRLPQEQRIKFLAGNGDLNYVGIVDWRRQGWDDNGEIAELPYLYEKTLNLNVTGAGSIGEGSKSRVDERKTFMEANRDSNETKSGSGKKSAKEKSSQNSFPHSVQKIEEKLSSISIPPLLMMDNGNGWRNEPDGDHVSVTFPPGAGLSTTFDKAIAWATGSVIAEMFRFRGANMILGPALTLHRTPYGARNWEYIGGEDPILSGQMGVSYSQGAHSKSVMTMAKHWINNHQETDRLGTTAKIINASTEFEIYLKPFEMYLQNGGTSVMCGYNRVEIVNNDGMLNNNSKDYYQLGGSLGNFWECDSSVTLGYAKKKYKNFFVGSDWAAVSHPEINADFLPLHGLDMELPGKRGDNGPKFTPEKLYQFLYQKVDQQLESRTWVQESVTRVLASMDSVGLLNKKNWPSNWANKKQMSDNPNDLWIDWNEKRGGSNGYSVEFDSNDSGKALLKKARAAARKIAVEGMVLLKNKNDLLPLDNGNSEPLDKGTLNSPVSLNIGLFGCTPSSIKSEDGIYNWNGFFINGAGSGAVHWNEATLKTLDQSLREVPSVGNVFNVYRNAKGELIQEGTQFKDCDIALVCYSQYAGEAYIMPNGGDREALKLHTMYGTSKDQDGYPGMPTQVHDHKCKKKVALVSTPGAFTNVVDTGKEGMGDFDSILMNVFPGEEFANAYTDVLFAREVPDEESLTKTPDEDSLHKTQAFPGGRLSFTLPEKESDVVAFIPHPGIVEYTEGNAMGYRYYQEKKIMPAYSFGYGLQYAKMSLSEPEGIVYNEAGLFRTPTFSNVCVENHSEKYRGSEVVFFWYKKEERDFYELLHFEKFHLQVGRKECKNHISFEPVMQWNGIDLVEYPIEKLKFYVSIQGLGENKYMKYPDHGENHFLKNAGEWNSYARFLVDNKMAGKLVEIKKTTPEQQLQDDAAVMFA